MARKSTNKRPSKRVDNELIWHDSEWRVVDGELVRRPGHPGVVKALFETVGEKLPFDSLNSVKRSMKEWGLSTDGIYLVHDSMGCARYAGRGQIFNRLRARLRAQPNELVYFSFYVVREKMHEREIESLIIRAASPLLAFNDKKVRLGIDPGSVRDFEPGTYYFRRKPADGRKSIQDESA